jgi:hypothetical protein
MSARTAGARGRPGDDARACESFQGDTKALASMHDVMGHQAHWTTVPQVSRRSRPGPSAVSAHNDVPVLGVLQYLQGLWSFL